MATRMIVEEFFTTGLIPGVFRMGLQEGGVGVAHITSPGNFWNSDVLTQEIIDLAMEAYEDLLSGRVVLDVPIQEEYYANWPDYR
jgi:basic membrane protein A